jgi:hypothetical protein
MRPSRLESRLRPGLAAPHRRFPAPILRTERMADAPITIRRYTDLDEMKADEYRYWQ